MRSAGTQFKYFPSTNVQILTCEELRLRQKEDVQISAAVYSLEPVDTEASMYASYDAATEQVAPHVCGRMLTYADD